MSEKIIQFPAQEVPKQEAAVSETEEFAVGDPILRKHAKAHPRGFLARMMKHEEETEAQGETLAGTPVRDNRRAVGKTQDGAKKTGRAVA